MPTYDQKCLSCAWDAEIHVAVGVHPPCPTCGGSTERLWRKSASVAGDDIPGGVVLENLGPTPMRFDSKRDILREATRRGLQPMVRHVPIPGTDKSPHTTSWDVPCAYTLEAAKALVSRMGTVEQTPADEPTVIGPTVTKTEIGAVIDQWS